MYLSLGSSVVERSPEEAGVVSSILTRGTINNFCKLIRACPPKLAKQTKAGMVQW
jgi:hypothetical protein